jgi:ubiquinone/menaquinone biosynthesis C-methylase UbiE
MTHDNHVRLIKDAIPNNQGGIWADVGSGEGAFTLALRDIAGSEVNIYSIDRNAYQLNLQRQNFTEKFPNTTIQYIHADFTNKLPVPQLDGIIAANAIHFTSDRVKTLKHLKQYLKPNGRLVIVEYNSDQGNEWVPYPFSYQTFVLIAKEAGFTRVNLLDTIPSHFLKEMYAAVAYQ